jgi:prefoldin subunit 5
VQPGRWVGLAVVSAVLLSALGVPSAQAAPDRQAQLRRLTKQAADLAKAYRGEIVNLEDAKKDAEKATARVRKLKRDLATAEEQVGLDAQMFTMGPSLGPLSTMLYLSSEKTERLTNINRLITQQKKAAKDADKKIDKLEDDIKELQSKRRQVERLLAKFGFQQPDAGSGLTSRMINVRNAIMQNFPMPFGVGCLRPGDPGEHGKGRACDFMMSGGGRTPDAVAKERGDALAQWCIDHASEYGIMYIIWQQRFYDMRTGAGWRMMSDRGSITANHYDHVHLSVL